MKLIRFALRFEKGAWLLVVSGKPMRPATDAEIFFWMKLKPTRKKFERRRQHAAMQGVAYEDGK